MKKLEALINNAIAAGYPSSLQIKVSHNHQTVFSGKFGKKFEYYDVASLTKIMVTVPLVMQLFEKKRLNLGDEIGKELGFLNERVGSISIEDLLRHFSGLVWWRPYYKKLMTFPLELRNAHLKKIFQNESIRRQSHCVYSDLDFILLGWLIEDLFDMSLDEAAKLHVFEPLDLDAFFIHENSQRKAPSFKKSFAPTEKTALRGVVQAQVHDENAWAMGGVAGHAGVFSTLESVSLYGEELLKLRLGKKSHLCASKTLSLFTKRAVPKTIGDWSLGFALPSRPVSTAGCGVSENAFGHTGFTGTSLWIDVKRKAVVTVLSNRTFPTRKDERFLQLRRDIHDLVWKELDH